MEARAVAVSTVNWDKGAGRGGGGGGGGEVASGNVEESRRNIAAKRQHACGLMQPSIKRRAAAGVIRRL